VSPSRASLVRSQSVLGRGDLGTSLVFVFPLFLIYEVSVMFTPTMNGVDFITAWVWDLVGRDKRTYLAVHGVAAAAFLACTLYMRSRNLLRLRTFTPMVAEAAIYAITLGSFIVFIMYEVLGIAPMALGEFGHALVVSLGAGVHEELVFRLGLFAGGAYLVRRAGITHTWAVLFALIGSSCLFSLAHHLGPLGEPFSVPVFIYRGLAGALFGLIFYFRSLSHAVYAHFLYDVYVFVLRPALEH
jgi:hypothetical protein